MARRYVNKFILQLEFQNLSSHNFGNTEEPVVKSISLKSLFEYKITKKKKICVYIKLVKSGTIWL